MFNHSMMKKLTILIFSVLCASISFAQCPLENTAFKGGEHLTYNLYYNWKFVWVKAGTASMSTVQSNYKGKTAWRASLITRGNDKVDQYFVLRDTLLSYSTLDLAPLYYKKAAREGKRYYIDEVFYDYAAGKTNARQHRKKADGNSDWLKKSYNECVYDMLTMFVRARSFDPSNWKKGHTIDFKMIDGNSCEPARIVYRGKSNIKGDNGVKYRCLQLSYMELDDGKYKRIVDFYVTDDSNHIPVRLDMFLKFGSAKAFIVGIKGNKSTISSIVK